jgi:hypothetical protein
MYMEDFLLREGSSGEEIGRYKKKCIPIASSDEWHILLWTADQCKSMGTEERRRAVSEGA